MDGNGRWAQSQGLARTAGHRSARDVVRDIVRACGELEIEILTLFTFGTDNWKRPWSEVLALMKLLRDSSSQELAELQENNVKLMATGNTDRLAKQAHRALNYAISQTAENTGLTLNLALSYDGRSDIVKAARQLAKEVASGGLEASQIDDRVANLFLCGYRELPQKPALIVAADYQQLRQVCHRGRVTTMHVLSGSLRGSFRTSSSVRICLHFLRIFLPFFRTCCFLPGTGGGAVAATPPWGWSGPGATRPPPPNLTAALPTGPPRVHAPGAAAAFAIMDSGAHTNAPPPRSTAGGPAAAPRLLQLVPPRLQLAAPPAGGAGGCPPAITATTRGDMRTSRTHETYAATRTQSRRKKAATPHQQKHGPPRAPATQLIE